MNGLDNATQCELPIKRERYVSDSQFLRIRWDDLVYGVWKFIYIPKDNENTGRLHTTIFSTTLRNRLEVDLICDQTDFRWQYNLVYECLEVDLRSQSRKYSGGLSEL